MADEKPKKDKVVLCIFDIIPDEPTDMDFIKNLTDVVLPKIAEEMDGGVEKTEVVPVAFGAHKVIARILIRQSQGGTGPLEEALANCPEIDRAECTMASLI